MNNQQEEEVAEEWDREVLLDPEWEIQQRKVCNYVSSWFFIFDNWKPSKT